jgi:hypothetical protein
MFNEHAKSKFCIWCIDWVSLYTEETLSLIYKIPQFSCTCFVLNEKTQDVTRDILKC